MGSGFSSLRLSGISQALGSHWSVFSGSDGVCLHWATVWRLGSVGVGGVSLAQLSRAGTGREDPASSRSLS